jgi:hypothetical protein
MEGRLFFGFETITKTGYLSNQTPAKFWREKRDCGG